MYINNSTSFFVDDRKKLGFKCLKDSEVALIVDEKISYIIERKRFDAALDQALAWKRLETGTHIQDDVTWIKHECAERHHELKYDSGYTEAHERAQSRYDGYPWENKF